MGTALRHARAIRESRDSGTSPLLKKRAPRSADANNTHETKTCVVVSIVGRVPVANGRAAVGGIVVPRAAAKHTLSSRPHNFACANRGARFQRARPISLKRCCAERVCDPTTLRTSDVYRLDRHDPAN